MMKLCNFYVFFLICMWPKTWLDFAWGVLVYSFPIPYNTFASFEWQLKKRRYWPCSNSHKNVGGNRLNYYFWTCVIHHLVNYCLDDNNSSSLNLLTKEVWRWVFLGNSISHLIRTGLFWTLSFFCVPFSRHCIIILCALLHLCFVSSLRLRVVGLKLLSALLDELSITT